jgi:hypothetical protein
MPVQLAIGTKLSPMAMAGSLSNHLVRR